MKPESRAQDERELRELVEAWASAVRRGDVGGAAARHATDVVLFDVAAPLQHRGLAAYREAFAPFLQGGPHERFELAELTFTVGSDVAFAHALLGIDAGAGYSVRLTLGFAKRSGAWTITHEHHSATI